MESIYMHIGKTECINMQIKYLSGKGKVFDFKFLGITCNFKYFCLPFNLGQSFNSLQYNVFYETYLSDSCSRYGKSLWRT